MFSFIGNEKKQQEKAYLVIIKQSDATSIYLSKKEIIMEHFIMVIRILIKRIFISILLFSCKDGLVLDEAGDSGFEIEIKNYANKVCKFYMGTYDINNICIAVDSLLYPNLVITKRTIENSSPNIDTRFSSAFTLNEHQDGLNEYGF